MFEWTDAQHLSWAMKNQTQFLPTTNQVADMCHTDRAISLKMMAATTAKKSRFLLSLLLLPFTTLR
jgi:hypothetical protein